MIRQAFAQRDHVVRQVTERRRARQQRDIRVAAQFAQRLAQPIRGALAVDARVRAGAERSAGLRLFVAEQDARAARGRRQRSGDAGRARRRL